MLLNLGRLEAMSYKAISFLPLWTSLLPCSREAGRNLGLGVTLTLG